MRKIFGILLVFLLFPTEFAYANPISITISDPTVYMIVDNGSPFETDLEITFSTDTTSFQVGVGPYGGDIYTGVYFTYTSIGLGLNNVLGTEPWTFELNGFIDDSFAIDNPGDYPVGFDGNSGYGGVLSAWDGISNLGPITGGTVSGFGGTISIQVFQSCLMLQ